MQYNIALQFEDGVTRFITCAANETLSDAAGTLITQSERGRVWQAST